MLKILKAKKENLEDIYNLHLTCKWELDMSGEIGAETYLDLRTRKEIKKVIKEGFSFLIMYDGEPSGYLLYSRYKDGLISKGIVITGKAKGLGVQRLVHQLNARNYKQYYIVSKYNCKSLKNILNLGLKPIGEINENDILYG